MKNDRRRRVNDDGGGPLTRRSKTGAELPPRETSPCVGCVRPGHTGNLARWPSLLDVALNGETTERGPAHGHKGQMPRRSEVTAPAGYAVVDRGKRRAALAARRQESCRRCLLHVGVQSLAKVVNRHSDHEQRGHDAGVIVTDSAGDVV